MLALLMKPLINRFHLVTVLCMLYVYDKYMFLKVFVYKNSSFKELSPFNPRIFLVDFNFSSFSRMGNYCGNKSYTITLYIIVLEDIFIPLLEM